MCQFDIPITGDVESLIARAKRLITNAGGSLAGNASQGVFEAKTPIGGIKGSYTTHGTMLSLSITKKPLLLSCSRIEKELSAVMR